MGIYFIPIECYHYPSIILFATIACDTVYQDLAHYEIVYEATVIWSHHDIAVIITIRISVSIYKAIDISNNKWNRC